MGDTAVCFTASTFKCPGGDAEFEADVAAGKCTETAGVKIDNMCEDGPCDSDSESLLCKMAKSRCEVDPETGVKCMPGMENDPCAESCRAADGAQAAAVATLALFFFAAMV